MKLAAAGALVAAALALGAEAHACVPLDFGQVSAPQGTATQQMVARAASIELMRVDQREHVLDTGMYEYGPIYRYTLRPVETLAGRTRGRLNVYAFDQSAPVGQYLRPEHWWEPPFDLAPGVVFPDPNDLENTPACVGLAYFELGATYLIFRDRGGEILQPTHLVHSSTMGDLQINGPAFERIQVPNSAWLSEVRNEVALQGARQPLFFDWLFDAVIGPPRN
ncbi:MAG: hypothetical protein JNL81_02910 [Hyphomonadaceae bacterium]|nr:hypothetical protein [Hyphomonadaceae bacterium]